MQVDQLDVSFVIPTHNRTELLASTIQSVLNQTRRPREILVVDNGTENRAASVLAPFGRDVTLVKSTPNVKQIARNTGFKAASSEWVATLDDDDLLHPTYLASMAEPMLDGRADIISSDHRKFRGAVFDEKTNFELAPSGYWDGIPQPPPGQNWSFVGKFPLERLLRRVPVYPSTTIIRREFALRIGGYDPRMLGIMAEDLEFLIRALTHGELSLVWEPLVNYRLHPGNDTASIIGQTTGRWRIFEFARNNHADLPASFREALDNDLPGRRLRIFDLAYRSENGKLIREVEPLLRAEDRTLKVRAHKIIGTAPEPVSKLVRKLIAARKRLSR